MPPGLQKILIPGSTLILTVSNTFLSSALTPSGVTALRARQFINFTATDCKVAYLHICEGACQLSDGRKDETTGKFISYLVSDFIKANDAS